MECHHFIKIREVQKERKPEDDTQSAMIEAKHNPIMGAEIGCCLCGEIRIIWNDGQVELNGK